MKKILLAVLMCALSLAGFAQKKDQPVTMAVAATNMNILFIGVNNPLDIAVSGYSDEDLIVSLNLGKIERKGEGHYIALVKAPGTAVLTISAKTKRGTVEIGKREFRIKKVPDPYPIVVGVDSNVDRGGVVTKAELQSAIGIEAYFPSDLIWRFQIVSFSVSVSQGGFTSTEYSNSGKFTPQQKRLMAIQSIGEKVYIEDIKCKGPDGSIRDLGSMVFKLKELD